MDRIKRNSVLRLSSFALLYSIVNARFTVDPYYEIAPGIKGIFFPDSDYPRFGTPTRHLTVPARGRTDFPRDEKENTGIFFTGSKPDMNDKPKSSVNMKPENREILMPDHPSVFGSDNAGGNSGPIFFPTEKSTKASAPPTTSQTIDEEECLISKGNIWFKGNCETLLTRSQCSQGQWLVLGKNGVPQCVTRPCPLGQVRFSTKCLSLLESNQFCGDSETLYTSLFGETYCDCEPDFVYDRESDKCEAEHSRGSCPDGQMLEVNDKGKVVCVDNPCGKDSLVLDSKTNKCFEKNFIGSCSIPGMAIIFDSEKNTAICANFLSTRNIFEVPSISTCPSGSRKDYFGECKATFRLAEVDIFSFRAPAQLIVRSQFQLCQNGYEKYPDGSCRKSNPILSF